MKIEWDFSELYAFANKLTDANLDETFKRITKQIAEVLLERIKGFTPIDETGKLIDGWNGNAFLVTEVEGGFEVEIVNKTEYAAWVNDGHRVRNRKDGEYLRVRNRIKVPTAYKWQKPKNDYYVFGHFFVERGIVQLTESKEIESIIMKELQNWWEGCF